VCINQPGSYQCSCDSGYNLNSDGHNCSLIQCPDPPDIDGLVFTCSSPSYVGDTCNVSCFDGDSDLLGSDTIQCNITGFWEAANAACENQELKKQSEDTPVIAIAIPIVVVVLAIVVLIAFGMAYCKYRSRKYKVNKGSNGINNTNSLTFKNPNYKDSFY